MSKVVIGIDPGLKGGIAIIDNGIISVHPMPLINDELDIGKLVDIVIVPHFYNSILIIEKVHAIFGSSAKSTFNFGDIYGQIKATVWGFQKRRILVQPKVWQKEIWIEEDIVSTPTKRKYKKSGLSIPKIDTKATSLNAFKRLFPEVNNLVGRSKKPHDGVIDALLIAEFGRRMYK